MPIHERVIPTSAGNVAVLEGSGSGLPLLLIHGNSSCKEVFRHQLESPLADLYRLIALDLPGHGRSSDARDPVRTYCLPGYAGVAGEVLDALGVGRAAVLGWSLGGHVALELLHQRPDIVGAMITGTPPVPRGVLGMIRGFHSHRDLFLVAKARLSEREVFRFARTCFGANREQLFLDMIARTDKRARPLLFRSMMKGVGADQKWIVESSCVPIAVVNGSAEPFAKLDYVAGLSYGDLWEDHCFVVDGAGHAPFWDSAEQFNPILTRFLGDLARRERLQPSDRRAADLAFSKAVGY
jgi:pimeloyl-ACP methyl ester carboxylesterase